MKRHWLMPVGVLLGVVLSGVALGAELPILVTIGASTTICSGTDTGWMPTNALAPQLNVLLYNAREHYPTTGAVHWVTYQPPTGPGFPADCGHANPQGSFGMEYSTANLVSTRLYGGGLVGVFKYAVGGTSLYYDWNPNNPYCYADSMMWLSNALAALPVETGCTGRVAGVFWTGGAVDGAGGTATAAAYGTNLMNFVLALRARFGQPRLPFVYGRTLPQWSNSQGVREGQQALTNRLSDVYMADSDDLYTPTLHYDNNGTITLGNRYADGFTAIMYSRMRLEVAVGGAVRLRLYALPLTLCHVFYADSLPSATWNELTAGQTDVLGVFDCQDSLPSATARYYRFSYPPPPRTPIISGLAVAPGSNAATLTWTSDIPSDSEAYYGATSAYGSSITNTASTTQHSLAITGLAAGTAYHFCVHSSSAGRTGTSSDSQFTTAGGPATWFVNTSPGVSMQVRVAGSPAITWFWGDGTASTGAMPPRHSLSPNSTNSLSVNPPSALTGFGVACQSTYTTTLSSVGGLTNYLNLQGIYLYSTALADLSLAGCTNLTYAALVGCTNVSTATANLWFNDLAAAQAGITNIASGGAMCSDPNKTFFCPAGKTDAGSDAARQALSGKGWNIVFY